MAEGRAALKRGRDVLARKALGQQNEFLKEANLSLRGLKDG